ncbi:hypothetical protein ACOMHN_040094 [Nucella lapillus]
MCPAVVSSQFNFCVYFTHIFEYVFLCGNAMHLPSQTYLRGGGRGRLWCDLCRCDARSSAPFFRFPWWKRPKSVMS